MTRSVAAVRTWSRRFSTTAAVRRPRGHTGEQRKQGKRRQGHRQAVK